MNPFVEQHQDEISGVLSCLDRFVITGTLPDICYAKAMASYLGARNIRLFDYPRWAEPLRDELRVNAERLAGEAGLRQVGRDQPATILRSMIDGTPKPYPIPGQRIQFPCKRIPANRIDVVEIKFLIRTAPVNIGAQLVFPTTGFGQNGIDAGRQIN